MRCASILAAVILLAACKQQPNAEGFPTANASREAPTGDLRVYASGRDRLCIANGGARFGLVTYGAGRANCTVKGTNAAPGEFMAIGDSACRIDYARSGDTVTIINSSAACRYYCAPDATLKNKVLRASSASTPVTDFAGDPLC